MSGIRLATKESNLMTCRPSQICPCGGFAAKTPSTSGKLDFATDSFLVMAVLIVQAVKFYEKIHLGHDFRKYWPNGIHRRMAHSTHLVLDLKAISGFGGSVRPLTNTNGRRKLVIESLTVQVVSNASIFQTR